MKNLHVIDKLNSGSRKDKKKYGTRGKNENKAAGKEMKKEYKK